MYAKLIVASGALIVMAVLAGLLLGSRWEVARADTESISLVPEKLGSSTILKRWNNKLYGTVEETGALYAAGVFGPAPIMLDFRRGDPRAHNGIGCFLVQGDQLVFERLRSLRTAGGLVVFDVGVARSGDTLRMVAAAACSAKECRGQRLPFTGGWNVKWSAKDLLGNSNPQGVVPVAVILKQKIGNDGQDATIAELDAELERVMPMIDLAPAQRLAAAQAGSETVTESNPGKG